MATVYKCITTCTWDGRYWDEGELTSPIPDDVKPPKHFQKVNDADELQEVLDTIDKEDEPQTFADLAAQISDAGRTGVGICAGDDLSLKSLAQLKTIAKEKGVYASSLRTRDELIEAIETVE